MKRIEALINLLFPQVRCVGCDEPRMLDPGSALCDQCETRIDALRVSNNTCARCLSPQKAGEACGFCANGGMDSLERAYAPFVYRDTVQKLVVRLKFGPCETAALPLARAMAETISGVQADAMVPVPLHRFGIRERGFNQSLHLCRLVASHRDIPVVEALRKVRRTKRQSSLHQKHREANVRAAFAACAPVNGLHILLVDDVRTSGATARACARALKQAGAASVCLLTAAVARHKAEYER